MHVDELTVVGNGNHHPVAIDITDRGGKIEVMNLILSVDTEEYHRLSELEVMFDLLIALAEHLHHQLVQGVIITSAHLQGIPGVTALHLPLQSHLFGLLTEGFLLGLILHLEQQPLLLKCQNGRNILIFHNWLQSYKKYS